MECGANSVSMDSTWWWVVTRSPSSNPALASTSEPVQTLITRSAEAERVRTHERISG